MVRPTKFKPEFIQLAKNYCQLGATDKKLAEYFEVSVEAIDEWKRLKPEFVQALKEGKLEFDTDVIEGSLRHRAQGYSHAAEKIFCDKEGNVIRADYTEHYPPDPTSMIFWLKNRRPKDWRDRQEHEIAGKDGGSILVNVNITEKKKS